MEEKISKTEQVNSALRNTGALFQKILDTNLLGHLLRNEIEATLIDITNAERNMIGQSIDNKK